MKYESVEKSGLAIWSQAQWQDANGHIFKDDMVSAMDLEEFFKKADTVWVCESEHGVQTLHLAKPADAKYEAQLVLLRPIEPETLEEKLKAILNDVALNHKEALEKIQQLIAK